MPSCVLRSCKNNIKTHNKTHGITYHQLPASGARRQEWINIIKMERDQHDWVPTRHTRICSAHFKEEDKYIASSDRVYISKTAVPAIHEQLSDENVPSNVPFPVPFTLNLINNIKSESAASNARGLSTKLELQGRIQQLLIQKMVLTEKCKIWKQKYVKAQKRLALLSQQNSASNCTSIILDAPNIRRRSGLKWIETEVLGI